LPELLGSIDPKMIHEWAIARQCLLKFSSFIVCYPIHRRLNLWQIANLVLKVFW